MPAAKCFNLRFKKKNRRKLREKVLNKAASLPGRFNSKVVLQILFEIFWDYEMHVCPEIL